jgi:hypothetical protein
VSLSHGTLLCLCYRGSALLDSTLLQTVDCRDAIPGLSLKKVCSQTSYIANLAFLLGVTCPSVIIHPPPSTRPRLLTYKKESLPLNLGVPIGYSEQTACLLISLCDTTGHARRPHSRWLCEFQEDWAYCDLVPKRPRTYRHITNSASSIVPSCLKCHVWLGPKNTSK